LNDREIFTKCLDALNRAASGGAYCKPEIRLLVRRLNQGPSNEHQEGYREALRDLVWFCDLRINEDHSEWDRALEMVINYAEEKLK